jgi:DNA-binding NtrC family response regulator
MTQTPPPAAPAVTQRVLVVEDLPDVRDSLRMLLTVALNVEVDAAEDGGQALALLAERPYSLVVTDLRMPKINGLRLLREVRDRRLPCTVIVVTGHGAVKEAVEAMRLGAYDFLTKPADPERLVLLVSRALRERALRDEAVALRDRLHGGRGFANLVSKDPRMLEAFDLIVAAADSPSPVLIEGEPGTGKEEVARAIHRAGSARRRGPFVPVECAAFADTQLEQELFGDQQMRPGAFAAARGGTLFLANVESIPLALQPRLFAALHDHRIEPADGTPVEVDVRTISSCTRSPEELVREGKLREDLFYRLGVLRVELPPLRDRPGDIPLLAAHFAERFSRPDRGPVEISPAALEELAKLPWPGNVRQLRAAVERACALTEDGAIRPEHLAG